MEHQSQLLTPFQRKLLLKSVQTELRPEYYRRIQIMLMADMGKSQTQICGTLGCSQETARYWIAVAREGKAHKWKDYPTGRPKTVNAQYLDCLKDLVSHSPSKYGYSFKRWTAQWLGKHLEKELGIKVSDRYINILLKQMGLSTRPGEKVVTELPKDKNSGIAISDLPSSAHEGAFDFFPAVQSHQVLPFSLIKGSGMSSQL